MVQDNIVDVPEVKNATEVPPTFKTTQVSEMGDTPLSKNYTANMPNEHYPLQKEAEYAIKEVVDHVAAPPSVDPENKTVHGVYSDTVKFNRTEDIHPMEVQTPLDGDFPCDPSLEVKVSIPAAEFRANSAIPYLPERYGCMGEYEVSREKASPAVVWSNVNFDVFEFSLQIIGMGDETCTRKGDGVGKILWHVVGMNSTAPKMELKEGASHDSRLLFGGKEEPNQYLEEYYSGPCPAAGTTECYRVKVLAHRANGWCQCGHQDVLFHRADKIEYQPWTYKKADLAPVGDNN